MRGASTGGLFWRQNGRHHWVMIRRLMTLVPEDVQILSLTSGECSSCVLPAGCSPGRCQTDRSSRPALVTLTMTMTATMTCSCATAHLILIRSATATIVLHIAAAAHLRSARLFSYLDDGDLSTGSMETVIRNRRIATNRFHPFNHRPDQVRNVATRC